MVHNGTRTTGKLRATVWLMRWAGEFDNPDYNGPSLEELESMTDDEFKKWVKDSRLFVNK